MVLEINNELQRLVQLRRSPTLKIAYQEQWVTLKNKASELLNVVSQKCIKIHTVVSMHFVFDVHFVEDQAPLLYLANTPYFPESEYLTREARIFKLLKYEYLEAEMQQISNELQRLVQLRRSPTLKTAYQEQWATLKNRASELLNSVSQKCIKIQDAAYMHCNTPYSQQCKSYM